MPINENFIRPSKWCNMHTKYMIFFFFFSLLVWPNVWLILRKKRKKKPYLPDPSSSFGYLLLFLLVLGSSSSFSFLLFSFFSCFCRFSPLPPLFYSCVIVLYCCPPLVFRYFLCFDSVSPRTTTSFKAFLFCPLLKFNFLFLFFVFVKNRIDPTSLIGNKELVRSNKNS